MAARLGDSHRLPVKNISTPPTMEILDIHNVDTTPVPCPLTERTAAGKGTKAANISH
jgi:hypothetical protein